MQRNVALTALGTSVFLLPGQQSSFVVGTARLGAAGLQSNQQATLQIQPASFEETTAKSSEGVRSGGVRAATAAAMSALALRLGFALPKRGARKADKAAIATGAPGAPSAMSSGSFASSSSSFMGSSMAGRVTAAAPTRSGSASMTMLFERFNEKALKAVMAAQQQARRLGHNFVSTEMLFVGVVSQGGGISDKVLKQFEVDGKKSHKGC